MVAGCTPDQLGSHPGPDATAAAPAQAGNAKSSDALEKCDAPLAVVTLDDAKDQRLDKTLSSLDLSSPADFLESVAKRSGCLEVVDGGLQMRAPDLAVSVDFLWSGVNGNDTIGSLGDSATGVGAMALSVFKALKVDSAQSTLIATDARSGKAVGVGQGSATNADLDVLSALGGISDAAGSVASADSQAATASSAVSGVLSAGASAAASAGATRASDPYHDTVEGKTVAAALVVAYNKMVVAVRAMPPLPSVVAAQPPDGAGHHGLRTKDKVVLVDYPAKDGEKVEDLAKGIVVNPTGRDHDGWTEIVHGDQWGWAPSRQLQRP